MEPNNCEIVDSGFNEITLGWNKNNFETYVLNPDGPKIRIGSSSEDKDIKKILSKIEYNSAHCFNFFSNIEKLTPQSFFMIYCLPE